MVVTEGAHAPLQHAAPAAAVPPVAQSHKKDNLFVAFDQYLRVVSPYVSLKISLIVLIDLNSWLARRLQRARPGARGLKHDEGRG
jgi:hypothetical protein